MFKKQKKQRKQKIGGVEEDAYEALLASESEIEDFEQELDEEEYMVSFNRFTPVNVLPRELELERQQNQRDYSIPGFPHVGPGNPIYPWYKNKLDNIAREHDIEYSIAKNPWDIYKADEKFMNAMNNIHTAKVDEWFVKHFTKHAIGMKYAWERRYGILYPTFTERQLSQLRQLPQFRYMEMKWAQNKYSDLQHNINLLQKVKPTTMNSQFLSKTREGARWLFNKFNKNTLLRTDYKTAGFKDVNDAGNKAIVSIINQMHETKFHKNNSNDDVDKYIQKFFQTHYDTKIFKYYQDYLKFGPTEKNKLPIFDLKNKTNYDWSVYKANNYLPSGDRLFAIDSAEQMFDEYLNSYQTKIHHDLEDFNEVNYWLSNREKLYNYDYQLSKAVEPNLI